ncbi:MAG TPA: DUF1330 domain-containing protein [Xanthobacteraceae bacterium]
MKIRYTVALSVFAGAAIGAAAVQGLHAQAKPPVYAVVDIADITDPEGFKALGQRTNEAATAVFKELGGRYIMRTGKITAIDGTPPKRFVVIAFDSMEKAQAWDNSPAQKEVNATRVKTTKSRVFIVDGMPQ